MKAKHLILLALPMLLAALTILSCAEEKDEYARPEFGDLTQQPNPAKAGENVTLTFGHKRKGNGIAGVTYTWTIRNLWTDEETGDKKDSVLSVHTNYDGYDKKDPTLTFKVPEDATAGSYSVDMTADFQCYIDNVLFDRLPSPVRGRLTIK